MEKDWTQKQYDEMTPEEKEKWHSYWHEVELKIREHERYQKIHNNPFK